MDLIKKVLSFEVEERNKILTEEKYDNIWENIKNEIGKGSFKQGIIESFMRRRKVFVAASIILVVGLISSNIILNNVENHKTNGNIVGNIVNDLGRDKKMQGYFGLFVPSLIFFNNSVYRSTGSIKESDIGKIIGKDNNGANVYEILNEPPEQKVALSMGNKYYMSYIVEPSPENTIIESALNSYSDNLGQLKFSSKTEIVKEIRKLNGVEVPIELETKIVDKGNFNYYVTLTVNWSLNNEKKKHIWNIEVRLNESNLVSEEGDKVPKWDGL